MKEIGLTKGYVALVDDEDADLVSGLKWYASTCAGRVCYALSEIRLGNRQRQRIKMHQMIMRPPLGMCVDHINGNGLDNRRENLRVGTMADNLHNRQPYAANRSGFKGVHKAAHGTRYYAHICVNYRKIYLGCFPTPQDAAKAYDLAAIEHHGRFAWLNFPPENHKQLDSRAKRHGWEEMTE